MTCRRILVVGAPAGGKRWLAGRIHALTGMPVLPLAARDTAAADGLSGLREWVALSSEADTAAVAAADADLVVLLRTPLWLRDARLVLRRAKAWLRRQDHPPLVPLLRRTHRWDADELPAVRGVLGSRGPVVASVASSEDVRGVLERILGIPATF